MINKYMIKCQFCNSIHDILKNIKICKDCNNLFKNNKPPADVDFHEISFTHKGKLMNIALIYRDRVEKMPKHVIDYFNDNDFDSIEDAIDKLGFRKK